MRRHKVVLSNEAREMIKKHVYFLAQINVGAARQLRKEIMADIWSFT